MRGVSERSDTDSGVNCHLWWIPGPARQYPYQDDGKQRFGGLLSYYFAAICYITSLRGDSRCWMPVKPVRPTCATWRADSGHASPQALDDLIDRPAHAPRAFRLLEGPTRLGSRQQGRCRARYPRPHRQPSWHPGCGRCRRFARRAARHSPRLHSWHEWLAGVAAAGQETIIRMRIRRFFCPARAASRDCGPTRTHAA